MVEGKKNLYLVHMDIEPHFLDVQLCAGAPTAGQESIDSFMTNLRDVIKQYEAEHLDSISPLKEQKMRLPFLAMFKDHHLHGTSVVYSDLRFHSTYTIENGVFNSKELDGMSLVDGLVKLLREERDGKMNLIVQFAPNPFFSEELNGLAEHYNPVVLGSYRENINPATEYRHDTRNLIICGSLEQAQKEAQKLEEQDALVIEVGSITDYEQLQTIVIPGDPAESVYVVAVDDLLGINLQMLGPKIQPLTEKFDNVVGIFASDADGGAAGVGMTTVKSFGEYLHNFVVGGQ